MPRADWPFLEQVKAQMEASSDHSLPAVTPNLMAAISDRLESAFSSESKQNLIDAQAQLEALLKLSLAKAHPSARAAAVGHSSSPRETAAAFALGQLSFAETFVARIARRRADDRFVQKLTDKRYERYVRSLIDKNLSGTELSEAVNETKETVSRKLQILRQLGILDYRREGNSMVNFLTPMAKKIVIEKNIAVYGPKDRLRRSGSVQKAISDQTVKIPFHMQKRPSFAA